jgi:adenylyltransferase/sulfurtransferase
MTIIPGKTPCLRCIFEEIPDAGSSPTCDTAGVIQPIISTISSIQVSESLKLLTGKMDKLHRSLLQADVWESDWRKINLAKPNPDCITCAKRNFEFLDAESGEMTTSLCGRDAVQVQPSNGALIDLKNLAENLRTIGDVMLNDFLLRLTVDGYEITLFRDSRAIIRGTDDPAIARSLYAKYIGS